MNDDRVFRGQGLASCGWSPVICSNTYHGWKGYSDLGRVVDDYSTKRFNAVAAEMPPFSWREIALGLLPHITSATYMTEPCHPCLTNETNASMSQGRDDKVAKLVSMGVPAGPVGLHLPCFGKRFRPPCEKIEPWQAGRRLHKLLRKVAWEEEQYHALDRSRRSRQEEKRLCVQGRGQRSRR
jgi:hypothetical protein